MPDQEFSLRDLRGDRPTPARMYDYYLGGKDNFAVDPAVRVVYVDNDPIVRAHAKALLPRDGTTAVIEADMRDPGPILEHPDLRRLIRFDEPVAVLFMSVLHFIADEHDPYGIVTAFRDATVPGSYLALSHITAPGQNSDGAEAAADVYKARATSPAILRSPKEIQALFDGYDLLDPGLVFLPQWRPDDPEDALDAESVWMLSGIGLKR